MINGDLHHVNRIPTTKRDSSDSSDSSHAAATPEVAKANASWSLLRISALTHLKLDDKGPDLQLIEAIQADGTVARKHIAG